MKTLPLACALLTGEDSGLDVAGAAPAAFAAGARDAGARVRPAMRRPALIIGAVVLAAAGSARAFDLTVEVTNARSASGYVGAAVYADGAGWLKDGGVLRAERAAAADNVVLVYSGLPAGRYAVSAMHDENGNGKLDANVVGMPTERFGFSRDARGRMGPPAFDDAVFELDADKTITIKLN